VVGKIEANGGSRDPERNWPSGFARRLTFMLGSTRSSSDGIGQLPAFIGEKPSNPMPSDLSGDHLSISCRSEFAHQVAQEAVIGRRP
jgi:hypothetical protein